MSWVIWQKGTWLRGVAATMNLILNGHAVDPQQAQPFYQLSVWRRVRGRGHNIKQILVMVWDKTRGRGKTEGTGYVLVAVLENNQGVRMGVERRRGLWERR